MFLKIWSYLGNYQITWWWVFDQPLQALAFFTLNNLGGAESPPINPQPTSPSYETLHKCDDT